jgi:iron complex outermembrane receptor protein
MKHFIIFLLCLTSITSFAQKTVKGKVTDASNNSPLMGANITLGNGSFVTTNNSGEFTVDCSKAAVFTVSFIGYEAVKYNIKNCNENINISLTPIASNLDAVEITATSNPNKSLLYQPSSISKLSTTEIKRGNGLFLDDAINTNVPGVTMNRRAVGSGQQFNIRGYGNGARGTRGVSSNFDGQGYKVYLNGFPVTDAEGITTMDDIDFGSIGNTEIVKGPSGTLFGLAIAGVVNLNTVKPEPGKTSIGQDILVGNYGLQRYTTHFAMGTDHSSLLVNYGHQKSDGFTIHNKSHKDFVNLAGSFQPNTKQSINVYGGYSNSYDERSGELTFTQYDNDDYSGNIRYIRNNGHSQVYTVRAGIGHTYMFNNKISNNTSVFGTASNSNASSAGGWTDKASTNFGLRSTFDTKFSVGNNISLNGITGVETQRQNATTLGYSMIKNPKDTAATWNYGNPYYYIIGPNTSNIYSTSATTSLFTEWTLALPSDFSVTAGIGISNMKITLDDRFYSASTPNKPTHYDTTYKFRVSPHVAINKVFNKNISAYASYSRGYKDPVSALFYIPYSTALGPNSGIVNSNLKPEVGDQFEIGTKGTLLKNKLSYQLAFFDAVFSDKLTTVAVPNPSNTATLYNYVVSGGKQDDKGIEALVKYTAYESATGFFTSVAPFANFTYADYKYKDYRFQTIGKTVTLPLKDSALTKDYSGHRVPGVSKVVVNFGMDVNTKPGIYANFTYSYKDGQEVTSLGTQTGEPVGVVVSGVTSSLYHATSYSLLNAKLGYKHSFGRFDLDAYFAVNNITNTKYPIMIFVNQYEDTYVAGPRNANVFGGLSLKYNIK